MKDKFCFKTPRQYSKSVHGPNAHMIKFSTDKCMFCILNGVILDLILTPADVFSAWFIWTFLLATLFGSQNRNLDCNTSKKAFIL